MRNKNQKGFTLVEILVVIAIIGLLAGAISLALANSRTKAKDAKRIAERKQVVSAINLYYSNSTPNAWPSSNNTWVCFGAPTTESCWNGAGGPYFGLDSLVTAMTPYLAKFPVTNADVGTYAYNRFLYNGSVAANAFGAGSPAGAWLVWPKEQPFNTGECNSANIYPVQHLDKYYYCYDWVGDR